MTDGTSSENLEELNRKRVLENTSHYLKSYLNPDKNWEKEITPRQRIYQIRYANVNWDAVSAHIRGMDYQNFLRTPYWKTIAAHTRYKAGYRCQLCNSARYLVTHHRNYGIHGFEHAHMHELIALCDYCHNKFHGQFPKWEPETHDDHSSKWELKWVVILAITSVIFLLCLMEHANFSWRGFSF